MNVYEPLPDALPPHDKLKVQHTPKPEAHAPWEEPPCK